MTFQIRTLPKFRIKPYCFNGFEPCSCLSVRSKSNFCCVSTAKAAKSP